MFAKGHKNEPKKVSATLLPPFLMLVCKAPELSSAGSKILKRLLLDGGCSYLLTFDPFFGTTSPSWQPPLPANNLFRLQVATQNQYQPGIPHREFCGFREFRATVPRRQPDRPPGGVGRGAVGPPDHHAPRPLPRTREPSHPTPKAPYPPWNDPPYCIFLTPKGSFRGGGALAHVKFSWRAFRNRFFACALKTLDIFFLRL